ncbi:aspartate aminotransferase [Candidatus Peregrinibacteria bacterium CG_4_10_14_0_2_um_filter_43_11]|nr:MAG: aspartate aminotransferase [Candidatus Peregrinibacteria bacterium CG_4_10_14_0_2_um_filter_43_11]
MLSSRIQKIQPSLTLAINAKAIAMKKQGIDVLKFGTGEPDFDTPDPIKEAAKRAIDDGFTKYTAVNGITELKDAICAKLKRDNGIDCDGGEVMVSNGGKQALYNCFMAILNPGDEVIVPSPYWVSYADMIAVADGVIKTVDTTVNHFKLTAEMVEQAITHRTRAVILNSPSNPTGAVMTREEIEKIGALALEHDFYVISDEVYEYFFYGSTKPFSLASVPKMKEWVITINAVSKTYSMTGWRIGYCAAPRALIKAMGNLQGHSTSNPCSIAQKAALAALTGPQDCVKQMVDEFKRRRDYVHKAMNQIPGFELANPEGAFYAFPKVSACFMAGRNNSFEFSEFLLEKAHVAVIPGGAFGKEGDGYIRFSYATSMNDLEEGMKRIRAVLN